MIEIVKRPNADVVTQWVTLKCDTCGRVHGTGTGIEMFEPGELNSIVADYQAIAYQSGWIGLTTITDMGSKGDTCWPCLMAELRRVRFEAAEQVTEQFMGPKVRAKP